MLSSSEIEYFKAQISYNERNIVHYQKQIAEAESQNEKMRQLLNDSE